MAEMVAEAKTIIVHMVCEKCGKGLMKPNMQLESTVFSLTYSHECDNCGNVQNYPVCYPYKKLVPIEPLREPTKNESNTKAGD